MYTCANKQFVQFLILTSEYTDTVLPITVQTPREAVDVLGFGFSRVLCRLLMFWRRNTEPQTGKPNNEPCAERARNNNKINVKKLSARMGKICPDAYLELL